MKHLKISKICTKWKKGLESACYWAAWDTLMSITFLWRIQTICSFSFPDPQLPQGSNTRQIIHPSMIIRRSKRGFPTLGNFSFNKSELLGWHLRFDAKGILNHNLLPILAKLLATPNMTAFVKSPRSRLQARAIAPPTTRSFGMFLPIGFSDEPNVSTSEESLLVLSSDLR